MFEISKQVTIETVQVNPARTEWVGIGAAAGLSGGRGAAGESTVGGGGRAVDEHGGAARAAGAGAGR